MQRLKTCLHDKATTTTTSPPCPNSLLCIALDPVLCALLKPSTVLAVLVGDGGLDGVVWVGLDEERLNEAQDRDDLVWRLPLVCAEQA